MASGDSPAAAPLAGRDYPRLLQRMERLLAVGRSLASTLDLQRLLRLIADAGRELTDTEAASILLLDARTGELRFEATTNMEAGQVDRVAVPLEGSIAGWIFQNSETLVVPDTRADPRWHARVDQQTAFDTRSILGAPLVVHGRTIGVLEALNKQTGPFTEDDVVVLQSLAAQAAVAIVNARLFEQSDLIAEMVHELRTPLTSLLVASQLLRHPSLGEPQRLDLAETLQRESQRLNALATSFLDLARLESGRIRFQLTRVPLPELVDECLEVVRPQAGQQGLALAAHLPPNLPALTTDRDKLKQVLLNLLTNAIKYNRPGGRVDVEVEARAGGVALAVRDTGRGIQPEALPRIFERFYRVPEAEAATSGTGLGLAIARRLVEALGGELTAESTPGIGSTFRISLPLAPRPTGPLVR
jgi:signal transduction histidine kinase